MHFCPVSGIHASIGRKRSRICVSEDTTSNQRMISLILFIAALVGVAEHRVLPAAKTEYSSHEILQRCNDERVSTLPISWVVTAQPFQLSFFPLHHRLRCGETYQIELFSRDQAGSVIAGLVVVALSEREPVGQFTPPSPHHYWHSMQCTNPNDIAVGLEIYPPQQSIHFEWTAPCDERVKDIVFHHFVYDGNSYSHGVLEVSLQDKQFQESVAISGRKLKRQVSIAPITPHLMVANAKFIHRISLDGNSFETLISGLGDTRGLDYHFREKFLFWSDIDSKTIMRSSLDGSNRVTLVDSDIQEPYDVAVDWVTNKLYWTEAQNKQIAVLDLMSGARQQKLIETAMDSNPRAIVVDPSTGWLYWSDWATTAKIMRASMDGQEVLTLHSRDTISLRWPNALTIDYDTQTLYWADAFYDTISSSGTVPGSAVNVVVSASTRYTNQPYSIVTLGGSLFFTDWFDGVITVSINATGYKIVTSTNLQHFCGMNPYGIELISEDKQIQMVNPCEVNNGGCSDLCLLSAVDPRGYSCNSTTDSVPTTSLTIGSCTTAGHTSCCTSGDCQGQPPNCYCDANCATFKDCCNDAPTDCPSPGPYLVASNIYYIHYLSLDGKMRMTTPINSRRVIGVDFHYNHNHLYWADRDDGVVWQSQLDGTRKIPIVNTTGIILPTAVSIDWVNNKIYWAGIYEDLNGSKIEVLDLDTKYQKTLFLQAPLIYSLVVDPINRWLYWTTFNNLSVIRASMDGSNMSVLYQSDASLFSFISLDISAQLLYWNEPQRVMRMNTDGTNLEVFVELPARSITATAEWKDQILWVDDTGIHTVTKTLSNITTLSDSLCTFSYGLNIVDEEKQQPEPNQCDGRCTKLCLLSAVDPRGYTCFDEGVESPPPPPPLGSCEDAGYSKCCDLGECWGSPTESYCFCDQGCYGNDDCCSDIQLSCSPCEGQLNFIQVPPEINVVVVGDAPLQLECRIATMTSNPAIQWFYKETPSSEAILIADENGPLNAAMYSVSSSTAEESVLSLISLSYAHSGTYTCEARGICEGEIITENASAEVIVHGPPIQPELTYEPFEEMGNLTLHCQSKGFPVPSINWLRRVGNDVQAVTTVATRIQLFSEVDSSQFPVEVDSTLYITAVTMEDSGMYICRATSGDFTGDYSVSSAPVQITIHSVNDCTVTSCQNNGQCVDTVGDTSCICTGNYGGKTCSDMINTPIKKPNITASPQNMSVMLAQPSNLTCEAQGIPSPVYQWYRDGEKIQGAIFSYYYIPEVTPDDRGNYTCQAINQGGIAESNPGLLTISDVYQFSAEVMISGTTNVTMVIDEFIIRNVGTTAENVEIYSIEKLNINLRNVTIVITVQSTSNTRNIALVLSRKLTVSGITTPFETIIRYDGCPNETLPLLAFLNVGDTAAIYSWPETEIGAPTLYQPCPSTASPNATVFRYCGGSYSSGAVWSDVNFSQCSLWAADALVNATSNPDILEPDAISETVDVIDTVLINEAIVNSEVAEQYLDVINNIQQANFSAVEQSEADTGASMRIINSLGRFQDEVEIPQNASNATAVYLRESFALQVKDIDTESFDGETLNVDLGSFEEAMRLNMSIPPEALVTAMDVLENVTASITVPPTFLNDLVLNNNSERMDDPSQRLSYSVFLSNILFQSPSQQAQNLSIGTIIVAVRLRDILSNQTLTMPLNTTFSISQEVQGDSSRNSMCVHWEASGMFGEWSNSSCREVESKMGQKTCECSRPSAHFAVLFDLNPRPPPPGVATALEIITYVGLVISILSLIIMIATYLSSKSLHNSYHGQILLNLCISLLGLYIVFLVAAHVTSVTGLCGLVSALLQYIILVFFGWTAAEAVYLYIKLVKVLGVDKYERGFTWKAGLVVWLAPIVIVAVSLAGYQYYTSEYYCRPTQWPFFFGIILPFTLIYIFDWVMFFVIIVSIIKHTRPRPASSDSNKKYNFKSIKQNLIIAVTLSLTFGLGWGLGLLATSTSVVGITIAFQVIFTLFVGSQGLLLLLLHGFRNEKARDIWKQWFYFFTCRYKKKVAYVPETGKQSKGSVSPSGINLPSTASYSLATLSRMNPSVSESFSSPTYASEFAETGVIVNDGAMPESESDYAEPIKEPLKPLADNNPPYDYAKPIEDPKEPITKPNPSYGQFLIPTGDQPNNTAVAGYEEIQPRGTSQQEESHGRQEEESYVYETVRTD